MSELFGNNNDGNSVNSNSNGASAMSVTSLPPGIIPRGNYSLPNEHPRTRGLDFTDEMETATRVVSSVGTAMARAASNTISILHRGISSLTKFSRDILNREMGKKLKNKQIIQETVEGIEDLNNAIYDALDGREYVLVLDCAELNDELSLLTVEEGKAYMAQCQANNLKTAAVNDKLVGIINEAFRLYQKGLRIDDEDIKIPEKPSKIYYLIELMFTKTGPTYRTDVDESEIERFYRAVTRWRDRLIQDSAEAVELGRMLPLMEAETTIDKLGVEKRIYPSNPPAYIERQIGPQLNFQRIYESGINPIEHFPSKGSLAYQKQTYDKKKKDDHEKEKLKRILEERYRRANKTPDELKLEKEAALRLSIANSAEKSKKARDANIKTRRNYGGKKRKTQKKNKKYSRKNKKHTGKNKRSNKRSNKRQKR